MGTSDGDASMRRDEGGAAWAAGVKTRGEAALEVEERHEEALYGRDGVWKGALGELEAEKVGEGECNMAIVRRSRSFCCRSGWPAVARDACSSLRAPRTARLSSEAGGANEGEAASEQRAGQGTARPNRTLQEAEARGAPLYNYAAGCTQRCGLPRHPRGASECSNWLCWPSRIEVPDARRGSARAQRPRCAGGLAASGRRAVQTGFWTQTETWRVKNSAPLITPVATEGG